MRTHTRQNESDDDWSIQSKRGKLFSELKLVTDNLLFISNTEVSWKAMASTVLAPYETIHHTNLFSTRTVSTQKVLAHLCIFSHADVHIGTVVLGAHTTQKERAHRHLRWWSSRSELALAQLKIKWKWVEGFSVRSWKYFFQLRKVFNFVIVRDALFSFLAGASEPYNKLHQATT